MISSRKIVDKPLTTRRSRDRKHGKRVVFCSSVSMSSFLEVSFKAFKLRLDHVSKIEVQQIKVEIIILNNRFMNKF